MFVSETDLAKHNDKTKFYLRIAEIVQVKSNPNFDLINLARKKEYVKRDRERERKKEKEGERERKGEKEIERERKREKEREREK